MNVYNTRKSQHGITLIEAVMTLLVVSLGLVVMLEAFETIFKGSLVSRNSAAARALAESKLEEMKEEAYTLSMEQNFSHVTRSAKAQAYADPLSQVARIGQKAFTWIVISEFMEVPANQTFAANVVVAPAGNTSSMVRYQSIVAWDDTVGPRSLTLTGYATDYRQYQ